jgi:hypothetical protein
MDQMDRIARRAQLIPVWSDVQEPAWMGVSSSELVFSDDRLESSIFRDEKPEPHF